MPTMPPSHHRNPLSALLIDIKISHTVFAMPFAVLGGFMAASTFGSVVWADFAGQLTLIVLCMVFARTVAMLSNRILDRAIDGMNPRTKHRAIPSGTASLPAARLLLIINALLFVLTASGFGVAWNNWLPLILSVPILTWLVVYPFLKRFTWLCHLYLGASLAMSPLAAAIAVRPETLTLLPIWLLSGAVLCWVAGFDIIYALQDVEIDQRDNLKSMPASLGTKRAMLMSQMLHCLCVALLFGVATTDPRMEWLFLGAVFVIALLLIYEHLTVNKWGTTKIALTFFTLNGIVSLVLGVAGIVDLLSSQ